MKLTYKSQIPYIQGKDSDMEIIFESMGRGLLLICIRNKKSHPVPYYWFFENGRKTALDVSINPITCELNYLKFFFQDEKVTAEQPKIDLQYKEMIPLFNLELFVTINIIYIKILISKDYFMNPIY